MELPFFSSQPDSSTHRRFCDNRKSAFVQRMHRQEEKTKFDEHPPVKWPETIPDPTFHFESCYNTDKVLRGPDKALMHPFVAWERRPAAVAGLWRVRGRTGRRVESRV